MPWEFDILHGIQMLRTEWLDNLMLWITHMGDWGLLFLALGGILISDKKTRRMGVSILFSLLFMQILGNGILKPLIARQRPCWIDSSVPLLVRVPKDYSFPSGHTFASFATAFAIWFRSRTAGVFALMFAGLMGFSRLYLYVHFPTDVFMGMLLGGLTAWGATNVVDYLWEEGEGFRFFRKDRN